MSVDRDALHDELDVAQHLVVHVVSQVGDLQYTWKEAQNVKKNEKEVKSAEIRTHTAEMDMVGGTKTKSDILASVEGGEGSSGSSWSNRYFRKSFSLRRTKAGSQR